MSSFVSVIVPVFNDPARLQQCLRALDDQSYPKADYEVIVVDNGSDESVAPLARPYPQVRVYQEGRPSSYAARNTGIAHAKGEIIAFTDADCIPANDWIEKGVAALLAAHGCGLVGGRVHAFFRDAARPNAVELYDASRGYRQHKFIEVDAFAATANMFTFRSMFDKVGSFDGELKSYGDVDWGRRVATSGYRLVYADDAVVSHPARYTLAALCNRILRISGGLHDAKRKGLDRREDHLALAGIPATAISVWRDPRLNTVGQRTQVLAVVALVQCLKLVERVRLLLGGTSRR